MTHIEDDDLVLHFYGEGTDRRAVEGHLTECETCRSRFDALQADMTALASVEVPHRGEEYGALVWARLLPALDAERQRRWWERLVPFRISWPGVALAGAAATLVVAAFVAGRYSLPVQPVAPAVPPASASAQAPAGVVKERILLVAVGEHLSRSRIVLAEISNRSGADAFDVATQQATAEDLVATNRLYRQTAASSGDPAMASVLEELERTLMEIANTPDTATADDLDRLRDRIESQGLIFKVTVLGSQLQQRQRDAVAPAAGATKTST